MGLTALGIYNQFVSSSHYMVPLTGSLHVLIIPLSPLSILIPCLTVILILQKTDLQYSRHFTAVQEIRIPLIYRAGTNWYVLFGNMHMFSFPQTMSNCT
jgi:hypothetical protein